MDFVSARLNSVLPMKYKNGIGIQVRIFQGGSIPKSGPVDKLTFLGLGYFRRTQKVALPKVTINISYISFFTLHKT